MATAKKKGCERYAGRHSDRMIKLITKIIYRHINALVMDYLVAEGYPKSAKHFASEANVAVPATPFVEQRVEIRSAIYSGDLECAIQKINDWNPQVSADLFILINFSTLFT